MEIIIAIVALVGVLVGHLVNRINVHHGAKIEGITSERAAWRKDIRRLSEEFMQESSLNEDKLIYYRNAFAIRLNPNDDNDNKILNFFDKIFDKGFFSIDAKVSENGEKVKENIESISISYAYRKEFSTMISLLLKHDWERSKGEIIGKEQERRLIFIGTAFILCLFIFVAFIVKTIQEFHLVFVPDSAIINLLVILLLLSRPLFFVSCLICVIIFNINESLEKMYMMNTEKMERGKFKYSDQSKE